MTGRLGPSDLAAPSVPGGRMQAFGFCLACWVTLALVLLAVGSSFAYLRLDFGTLFSAESRGYMAQFFLSFFPPNLSAEFLLRTARATLETLAISAVSTLLAALFGLLLALPGSGRLGVTLQWLARWLMNLLRSVPELVWAAIMVLAAGLGPFAGTLALALHTTGVLGRLFAETLENAPAQPQAALHDAGSGSIAAFTYGTLPVIWPQLIAYSMYRWEMNIRMATVLGFVGAGGLGQLLYFHLSIFQQAEASTVMIAMLLLVVLVDNASTLLRRRLAGAGG